MGTKHLVVHKGVEWVVRRHLKNESFLNYMFAYLKKKKKLFKTFTDHSLVLHNLQ